MKQDKHDNVIGRPCAYDLDKIMTNYKLPEDAQFNYKQSPHLINRTQTQKHLVCFD